MVLVVVFALVIVFGPWVAQGMMRGSADRSGGPMGVFEEIFHPVVRDAQVALQEHDVRQDAADGDGEEPDEEPDGPTDPETPEAPRTPRPPGQA